MCGRSEFACYKLSGLIAWAVFILMYLVNAYSNIQIQNNDFGDKTSIFTQAIDDWSQKSWTEFKFGSDGNCALGYEKIGAEWLGTHRSNVTAGELRVVEDDSWTSSDFPAVAPVLQTMLYTDMKDALCGKRGGQPFMDLEQA